MEAAANIARARRAKNRADGSQCFAMIRRNCRGLFLPEAAEKKLLLRLERRDVVFVNAADPLKGKFKPRRHGNFRIALHFQSTAALRSCFGKSARHQEAVFCNGVLGNGNIFINGFFRSKKMEGSPVVLQLKGHRRHKLGDIGNHPMDMLCFGAQPFFCTFYRLRRYVAHPYALKFLFEHRVHKMAVATADIDYIGVGRRRNRSTNSMEVLG